MRRAAIVAIALAATLMGCRSSPVGDCFQARARGASTVAEAAGRPAGPTAVPDDARGARLAELTYELERPTTAAFAPGDDARMYVTEQAGVIRVLELGGPPDAPIATKVSKWLDLSDRAVYGDNEQGLLGLVFHPRWAEGGDHARLYVNYTDRDGATRVVELRAPGGKPDLATARELLHVAQPATNHNGGHLAFGPDGKLWVGLGDGGRGGDPWGNSQSCGVRLGKMLRIDVDTGAVETVASGLRNPWRYSFDRATGDLYIADVGQDLWEWVHVAPADDLVGHNFGWNVVEGYECFEAGTCSRIGLTPPIVDYGHEEGCSISGGHVYRGAALPALAGHYFFADYCSGLVRSVRWERGAVTAHWDWKPVLDADARLAKVVSFAEDGAGELYVVTLVGAIYKLVPAP